MNTYFSALNSVLIVSTLLFINPYADAKLLLISLPHYFFTILFTTFYFYLSHTVIRFFGGRTGFNDFHLIGRIGQRHYIKGLERQQILF